MSNFVAAWGLLKKLFGAAILIPFGLAQIVIAVWLVGAVGESWIAIAAAAWLGYEGLNTVIAVLSGFVGGGGPGMSDTAGGATLATRSELRRNGLIKW